jgi:hypothetical protein
MSETQTNRVRADVVVGDLGRRAVPTRGRRPSGPRVRQARRDRDGYPSPRVRFVTGLTLIVALAMGTVGIQAYVRVGHQQARVSALQAELTGLQRRIDADEHGAASDRRHVRGVAAQARSARQAVSRVSWALQNVPSEAQLAGVRSELAAYASCIPQLQGEIARLSIRWRIDPAKPSADYFRLSTRARTSASCRTARSTRSTASVAEPAPGSAISTAAATSAIERSVRASRSASRLAKWW